MFVKHFNIYLNFRIQILKAQLNSNASQLQFSSVKQIYILVPTILRSPRISAPGRPGMQCLSKANQHDWLHIQIQPWVLMNASS